VNGDPTVYVLGWPWALGSSTECVSLGPDISSITYRGSAVLACPSEIRLLPIGGSADLARLASTEGVALYELPQGRAGSSDSGLEMQTYSGSVHARWRVNLDGALTRYAQSASGEPEESFESIAVFDWWDAFDDLLGRALEPDRAIPWPEVEGWLGQQSRSSEPRRALIVEIAEKLGPSISDRTQHLRRILLRQRDLVPASRVQQMDEECLRWFIRRPGETLAEKAGPRQELISVVRNETVDTLENRVLKDFLIRCARAGSRYVRRFQASYRDSERVLLVQRYVQACTEALRRPEFNEIQRPRPGAQPNYVLQSDPRYRDIWHWYQRLLRNQDSEEQIWNWQSRLWADVVRLLVGAGCHVLSSTGGGMRPTGSNLARAPLLVRTSGALGGRLKDSWSPGPLFVRHGHDSAGVLSFVDAPLAKHHPVVSELGAAGGHLYLVREGLGSSSECDVLVVWGLNTMSSSQEFSVETAAESASSSLCRVKQTLDLRNHSLRRLDGLIIANSLNDMVESDWEPPSEFTSDPTVAVITIGSDPKVWDDAALEIGAVLDRWL